MLSPQSTPYDWCIVGGGIAGLTAARALAQHGQRVVVIEQSVIGHGATAAAGGMLAPLVEARSAEPHTVQFGMEALRFYPEFVAQLQAEAEMNVGYRTEGTLVVAPDRDQAEQLRHLFAEQQRLQLPVEWLSGYELRQIEPYLSPTVVGGIRSQQDHQVDNRLLAVALARAVVRLGGKVIENVGELYPERVGGTWQAEANGVSIKAANILLAEGAAATALRRMLPDIAKHLRPVKGQFLRLDQRELHLIDHVVRTTEVYLVPKNNGQIVVGASAEDRGFDNRNTVGEIFELLRAAWECIPAVRELPILETGVGFRPATSDHLPLLGRTQIEGLAVAAGYYRHGILFAPYAAHLLADHLVQQASNQWIHTFSPERFHEPNRQR
ncbi:MAG: glycine oxidase ThiO [Armatimonadetes bacterium]|nr:glycine oxidase ThiO [Armatimonadota bacterium]